MLNVTIFYAKCQLYLAQYYYITFHIYYLSYFLLIINFILPNKFLVSLLIKYNTTKVNNKITTNIIPNNSTQVIIFKLSPSIISSILNKLILSSTNMHINNIYFLSKSICLIFNTLLDTNFVFKNIFTKKANAVANNIPFILNGITNITDNITLIEAHIKI